MQNLYKDLVTLLLKNDTFKSEEGKILKNKVTEMAVSNDKTLILPLLKNAKLKKHFFDEIEKGVIVFDREKFIRFINNKEFLPNSFTAFSNKIGLHDGDEYIHSSDKVSLVWAYKDCVLEGGSEKEGETKDEFFYNETLAPDEIDRLLERKVLTNIHKITGKKEEKLDTFDNQNFVFKGNNLLLMHSIKNRFRKKIKLIYIDPPFNKDAEAFYNDKFRHSTWLTFIKNRLEVAKELLSDDGFICVHLDNIEMAYCKVLLDEIFGRENYRNTVTLTTNDPSGFKATGDSIFSTSNHILIYSNEKKAPITRTYIETSYDEMYGKVLEDRNVPISKWRWKNIGDVVAEESGQKNSREAKKELGVEEFKQRVSDYAIKNAERVFRTAAIQGGARQKRLTTIEKSHSVRNKVMVHPNDDIENFYILNGEGIIFYDKKVMEIDGNIVSASLITDVWTDISWNGIANEGGVKLKNGKKPEKLLERVISMLTDEGDYILDYHLGSGTTCAVAHKMKRRYIGIEQLDYGDNSGYQRLINVIKGDKTGVSEKYKWKGGGSFVYAELMENNQFFIDEIEKTTTSKKLLSLYEKMKKESFFRYEVNLSNFDVKEFSKLELADQKQVLLECLDKNHLYVNYSDIDDTTYKVSAEDKKSNKLFYGE